MGGLKGVEGFESPPDGGFRGWMIYENLGVKKKRWAGMK